MFRVMINARTVETIGNYQTGIVASSSIYGYLIDNMLRNQWIAEAKLQGNRKGWCDFFDLCRKLGRPVPPPKGPKCPS